MATLIVSLVFALHEVPHAGAAPLSVVVPFALAAAAFVLLLAVTVFLFMRVPSSFVPQEDQGYIFGNVQLPDGATLERTRRMAGELGKIIQANPGVQNTMVINGFDLLGPNPLYEQIALGGILLIAVGLDAWSRLRQH